MTTTMRRRAAALASAAAAAVLLAACGTPVVNPVSGQSERSAMSESQELEAGRKAHRDVLKDYTPVADLALQAYVDSVGQKLARQSHRANLKWTFTVLDSQEVNAFALPGGYVYITRGLMAYLDSEADLAGVLGHEIGHVTARHAAQRESRAQSAGFGVLAASVVGAVLEGAGVQGAGQLANQSAQAAAAGYVSRYGREQELQADQLGAEYLARAGYNPSNMIDVIRVLKDQERYADDNARAEGRTPAARNSWLASHPSSDQRLEEITRTAARYPASGYGDDQRSRYLKAIDGLTFGESAAQGLTRGRTYYHEELGFAITAPHGWSIVNGNDQLLIVNGTRDAGVVLRVAPSAMGLDHDTVIRNLLNPTQGRAERVSLGPNRLAATRFVGERRSDDGVQPLRVTVVTGPSNRVYLIGHAAADGHALNANREALRDTEETFRSITGAERSTVSPWRLHTTALPGGGFAELARRSPLGARAEQQLLLLNAAYGGQAAPAPGTQVKVVE